MVVGEKLTPAQCNFTHQDRIWKDHVHKEYAGRKKWQNDWGFMHDEYLTLHKKMKDIQQAMTMKSATLTPSPSASKTSIPIKLPPLQAPKQDVSNPFPLVTSKQVGWRSGPQYNLEVYGRWGRPKYSIIKQLKWPVDAVP